MQSEITIIVFAFLLLGSIPLQASGQSSPISDHVVINEVDTNPPGDDSKSISEWVELYNPTNEEVYLGGWKIASSSVLKKTLTIPVGTTIKPDQFLKFSYKAIWFTDVGEKVELRDESGNVIDETPILSDLENDFNSWQRLYDGFGSNSIDDWKFDISTAGSTNGKLVTAQISSDISVSISVDKPSYIFDEIVTLSGTVSKQIFVEKPTFRQETIDVVVLGPNYYKTFTLYPDFFLGYDTSIKLQKVLGINEGVYDVTVSYAGTNAKTQFFVGTEILDIIPQEESVLTIFTDKESYMPGEIAIIFAKTSEIVPLEGLTFEIINPNGVKIHEGTSFPNLGGVNTSVRGGDFIAPQDTQFTTNFYFDLLSSSYGQHRIIAKYSTQTASSTFEVLEDIKDDKLLTLQTDKPAYRLGETVIISGRLNNLFVPTLDIEILQTGIVSLDVGTQNVLKDLNAVRLAGDSSFKYEFQIPNNPARLGDYRVTVFKDVGEAITYFSVLENPDDYVAISKPLSISTNKVVFDVGEKMIISGNVANPKTRTSFEIPTITISILDEKGTPLTIVALLKEYEHRSTNPFIADYTFTAIPDIVGNYKIEVPLSRAIFEPGDYSLEANYNEGMLFSTTSFSVIDPLDIDERFILKLNKQVFGFGEQVTLDGVIPGLSQGIGITITLIKPDGDTNRYGALVDDSKFSWSWTTPISEKKHVVFNERSVISSNYGVYQLIVGTDSGHKNIFFKVSPNPEEDSLTVLPLQVTTDKPIYDAGETLHVLGSAIKRTQGTEGLVVEDRAQIIIRHGEFPFKQIFDAAVYLDSGGNFKSSFVLPVSIFLDGDYKVTAIYQGLRSETIFKVDSDFIIGGDQPLILLLSTDKDEYQLGDTVQITGRPSKLVYLENIQVAVVHESEVEINCGEHVCGRQGTTTHVNPTPSGTFTFDHKIPESDDAKGKYEIIADTEFGVYSTFFVVTDKISGIVTDQDQLVFGKRITEKFNRIPDTFVPISVTEKTFDGIEKLPRVIQGSLLTPVRGEEGNVNLKISTEDGTCIIGQENDCLITDSTRGPGTIYQIIEIEGVEYKIRYSGPDVRLEKFTILPESSDETIPNSIWNVEVIKDDQPSRLYYKITYVSTE